MLLVRLLIVLLAVSIVGLAVIGLVTGNPVYYSRALKLARIGLVAALIFFAVVFISQWM